MPLKMIVLESDNKCPQIDFADRVASQFRLCRKILDTVWMVHTEEDVSSLRQRLLVEADAQIDLMVCEVSDWSGASDAYESAEISRGMSH